MKRLLQLSAWALLLAGGAFITACNTVEGAGRDVEAAGDAVADTAEDVKDDLDD
jgi:entericidin B